MGNVQPAMVQLRAFQMGAASATESSGRVKAAVAARKEAATTSNWASGADMQSATMVRRASQVDAASATTSFGSVKAAVAARRVSNGNCAVSGTLSEGFAIALRNPYDPLSIGFACPRKRAATAFCCCQLPIPAMNGKLAPHHGSD